MDKFNKNINKNIEKLKEINMKDILLGKHKEETATLPYKVSFEI